MGKLKANLKAIEKQARKKIRKDIRSYAIKPGDVVTDPAVILRDREGVAVAVSNDDFGTTERRQHDTVKIVNEGKPEIHARVTTVTPLDTMLNRKQLAWEKDGDHQRLWMAGDHLRRDFYLAGMQPRIISTLSPLPSGKGEISDRAIGARRRYQQAIDAVGPILSPVLIHVVCDDLPVNTWSKRGGRRDEIISMTLFKAALETLAHYYGY
ncbi:MAG: hypothetical protein E6Q98_19955 [Rhodospirillaceae bacterium]|nr:MAG: hypothetical protein E6Q98_19955 [Rhodospirillaceae bacterium]